MHSFNRKNRFWVMKARPRGNNFAASLELREEAGIDVPDGTFVTRNAYLSMDAGTRMYMTDREDSYHPPIPVGEKLMGTVLGEIVQSHHSDFAVGEKLRSYGQWSDYSVVDPKTMYPSRVDDAQTELVNYIGLYGANGWTAYTGVIDTARVKAGDTFVVSAAAGCTGLLPRCRNFLVLGQGTDALHPGEAAINVFPHQLFTVAITPHHDRAPAKGVKVQHPLVPYHAGRCTGTIGPVADSECHTTFRIVGILAQSAVWPVVVNESATGNHHPAAALLDALHMPDLSAFHRLPQAPYVVGSFNQRFGACRQDRQREVGVTATRGVALGYVRRELPTAIKHRKLTVVDHTAIAKKRCRVGGERGPRRKENCPECDKNNDHEGNRGPYKGLLDHRMLIRCYR